MGEDLFAAFPDLTARADQILGYSVRELCVRDPERRLDLTQFTQPALYVVNALRFFQMREQDGRPPDWVLGHSMGEYNALLAAGVFDFETGLRLVKKRGELMGQARDGAMAAIIGLDEERVREVLASSGASAVDMANLNSPFQIVIAGAQDQIANLKDTFTRAGAQRYVVLRVSAAFHSRFMKPAMVEFSRFVAGFELAAPAIPVIANLTARPYRTEQLRQTMSEQISSPVRWSESIRYLIGKGVKEFVECGQGAVLTGLHAQISRESVPLLVDTDSEPAKRDTPAVIGEQLAREPSIARPRPAQAATRGILPESLGDTEFLKDYRLRYAYAAGSIADGISSKELVVRMGKAGLIGYLGAKGLALSAVAEQLRDIRRQLPDGQAYGASLSPDLERPRLEWDTVRLYLDHGVHNVEATSYLQITPALVWFRLKGAHRAPNGRATTPGRILARVSHPEIARAFMSPAPESLLQQLLREGRLDPDEVALARELPLSDDICVHADAGSHPDCGAGVVLLPALMQLRDQVMREYGYKRAIRMGLSGEIGAPAAAASAFLLGADFIVTDTLNQCSPEADTSNRVKDLLQAANVQDSTCAPAEDLFEMGAKLRVLKRGLLFPARANRLYDLYRHHASLAELDGKTKEQLQRRYFKRDLEEIWSETKARRQLGSEEIAAIERDPKRKMALVFRWYLQQGAESARRGDDHQADYQIHVGPAMGAFNAWVKGTDLEDWHHRHVDTIAERLMQASADLIHRRLHSLSKSVQ
jgi:trans-AT polyketide synthase/acyltransferase/oxidoreductase domain-containing protein